MYGEAGLLVPLGVRGLGKRWSRRVQVGAGCHVLRTERRFSARLEEGWESVVPD